MGLALGLRSAAAFVAEAGQRLAHDPARDGVLHCLKEVFVDLGVLRPGYLEQFLVILEALGNGDGRVVSDGLGNSHRLLALRRIVRIVVMHHGGARTLFRILHPQPLDVALKPARPEDCLEQRAAHAVAAALAIAEDQELLLGHRCALRGPGISEQLQIAHLRVKAIAEEKKLLWAIADVHQLRLALRGVEDHLLYAETVAGSIENAIQHSVEVEFAELRFDELLYILGQR